MDTTKESLEQTIQDLYSAEKQGSQAMPQLARRVQNQQLQGAFAVHMRETDTQLIRLEQIARQLGIDAGGKTCRAMQELIQQAQDRLNQLADDSVDAAIIEGAQKMAQYEVASYSKASKLARQAGQNQIASLLELTLKEEKVADKQLLKIASSAMARQAARA